jgi:hypothetical protein
MTQTQGFTMKTRVKAGAGPWIVANHNQGMTVKTAVKSGLGGWIAGNHNQTTR